MISSEWVLEKKTGGKDGRARGREKGRIDTQTDKNASARHFGDDCHFSSFLGFCDMAEDRGCEQVDLVFNCPYLHFFHRPSSELRRQPRQKTLKNNHHPPQRGINFPKSLSPFFMHLNHFGENSLEDCAIIKNGLKK